MTSRIARASEPEYGALDAAVESGDARLVGERYTPDGEKLIAVEVPGFEGNVDRGAIRIGREFFTTALRDYEDWQEKWWREAVQNSVDAGARHIRCEIIQNTDRSWTISAEDDGGGMSEEVLIDKFLVLGGTTKVGGTTTGGFGKAKELLVLPWMTWEVHTRDRRVRGTGVEYEVEPAEFLAGTRLTVVMPDDQTTSEAACLAFLGKCYLPSTRFTVNGQSVRANLAPGEAIRRFADDAAELYHDKKDTFAQRLLVRVNGLYMFNIYVSAGVTGTLIVELLRSSVELLTANRDGFRNADLRYDVQNFVSQLAADTKSALRKKKGLIRAKFLGTGKFTAADNKRLAATMLENLGSVEPAAAVKKTKLVLSDDQTETVVRILTKYGGSEQPEREVPDGAPGADEEVEGAPPLNFRVSGDLARAMLGGTEMAGAAHVEAAVKQLAWEPDFFLVNEIEGFKVPKKFYPDTMAANVRKLGRFWAEMCRFVLIQLGSTEHFGVGFVFQTDTGAEFIHEDDENWLMLNPFTLTRPDSPMLTLSDKEHVAWLYAAAVHECTHMADGISYHDESFASAMTRNVARTSGKEKQIRAIKSLVLGVERERKESAKASDRALEQRAQTLVVQIVNATGSMDIWGLKGDVKQRLGAFNLPSGYDTDWLKERVLGPLARQGVIDWRPEQDMVYRAGEGR